MTSKKCEMVKNSIVLLKTNTPPHPPPVGGQSPMQPTYNEQHPGSHGGGVVTAISGGSPPIAGVVKRCGWQFGGSAVCENHMMSHDLQQDVT